MNARGVAIASLLLTCAVAPLDAGVFTVVNTDNDGVGSLRWAIDQVNASPGPHRITFNIPGTGVHVIQPTSQLPFVVNKVAIDATTQPGYFSAPAVAGTPLIELDGSSTPEFGGLLITGNGSSVRGLSIGDFSGGVGLAITADACTVAANHLGLDASGAVAKPNDQGLLLEGGSFAVIGGPTAKDRNVISGNSNVNVGIQQHPDAKVQGNYIGTNAAGTATLGNAGFGINAFGAPRTWIGGLNPGEGNLIAGHAIEGLRVIDSSLGAADGYRVYGNRIGTDVHGTSARPNDIGVRFQSANGIIGSPQAPNVISGNAAVGLRVIGNANLIQDNYVGTTPDGTRPLGNGGDGIYVFGQGNQFLRNTIAGNGGSGIVGEVVSGTFNTVIRGNAIGTNRNGAADLGNAVYGVWIRSSNNFIGGSNEADANVIAYNTSGIAQTGLTAGNSYRRNRVYANSFVDIDLNADGVTLNDGDDSDGGPNDQLNYPILSSVTYSAGQLTVMGSLHTYSGRQVIVDIYSSPACNNLGHGGGETWVGSVAGVTNPSGDLPILFQSSGVQGIAGYSFTATTTMLEDGVYSSTSEFSPCVSLAPSVSTDPPGTSSAFALGPPRPQPASGTLEVPFALSRPSRVALRAYDVAGRRVATLLDQAREAGQHRVSWSTDGIPPGVYRIRIDAAATDGSGESFKASRSVVVLR